MKYSIQVNEVKARERMQGEAASPLRGFASVVFGDSFKITNIAILQAGDGRMFVSMPRYKTNQKDESGRDIYKDICNPITKEFRESLYSDIIEVFENRNREKADKNIIDTEMPNIRVSISPYEKEGSNMKALARIVLDDCFVINNVAILEGRNGNNFVAMPGYKPNQQDEQGKDVYRDICYPVTAEFRERVYGALMEEYSKIISEKNEKISEKKRIES